MPKPIIEQTIVRLGNPLKPEHGAYKSILFAEGSGNVRTQLENLKKELDKGFVLLEIEAVSF
jgi:hypothetical protein